MKRIVRPLDILWYEAENIVGSEPMVIHLVREYYISKRVDCKFASGNGYSCRCFWRLFPLRHSLL